MTDQILATNMQQAYDAGRDAQAQQDSNAAAYAPAAPPQITPQLKAQIDSQIKVEVAEMGTSRRRRSRITGASCHPQRP